MKSIIFFIVLIFSTQVLGQFSGTSKSGRLFSKKIPIEKTEKSSPKILIINPALNDKNESYSDSKTIVITGTIEDEYGIEKLLINNKNISIDDSYRFSNEVRLKDGVNIINIIASNIEGKSASLNFQIITDSKLVAPEIVILEPNLTNSNDYKHSESIITIRGKIKSVSGIKDITVNNSNATIMRNDEFFSNVQLNDGINDIIVKATDLKNQSVERRFKVITPIDNLGPEITLIEPAAVRGVKVVRKNDVITVRGKAVDKSGVFEVYVNERKTNLLPNNEFSIQMYLAMGDNKIMIRAIDNKYNVSADTFIVNRQLEEIIKAGKYIALLIGINSYEGYWNSLKNAVNDASGLGEILKNEYQFDEVYTLLDKDATRRNIIQKFEWLAANTSGDDNVLIFYAGHGQFNRILNKGYWVPIDAKTNSVADYISNNDVKTFLGGIPSKHTLLVTDACFAGDIFRGPRGESIAFDPNDMSKYYKEVYKKPSRLALTSGSIEPVMDAGKDNHSIFSYYLIKALEKNNQKYLDASQLFNEFRMAVANNSDQTPQLQVVRDANDEGGQFIFIRKNGD